VSTMCCVKLHSTCRTSAFSININSERYPLNIAQTSKSLLCYYLTPTRQNHPRIWRGGSIGGSLDNRKFYGVILPGGSSLWVIKRLQDKKNNSNLFQLVILLHFVTSFWEKNTSIQARFNS
jgi:hypothetical protein